MKSLLRCAPLIAFFCVPGGVSNSFGAGKNFAVTYAASENAGELQLGVTYRIWIPDDVTMLRGIIVHQHGCGVGACKGGQTAADDLHWQALAKKWDCALLGPSYHQAEKDNCRLWCDPRNGSDKTFLKSLADFAKQSGHAELDRVPWCLWGHSGGGFWSSLMLTLHPDRIAAIWFRSGSAFGAWERGEIPPPQLTSAVYKVPLMFNGGVKEENDKRHGPARVADRAMFKAWREHGSPAGFAPDPRTGHECGDSRYLAIPFFDACLAMRLPDKGAATQQLRPVDMKPAWLSLMPGNAAKPASSYSGNVADAGWLPNEQLAKAWSEYVTTGAVGDTTPPPVPTKVAAVGKADGFEITWDAEADFESGLQAFIIQRDGKALVQLPEKPVGKSGRPLFQQMSYHDTPEQPLPAMKFTDASAKPGEKHEYRVIAVNSVGLKSAPATASP